MSDTYATVRQAILDRRQIIASYEGHAREMCPHVIGTKSGRPRALFFQFGGTSDTGLPGGGDWRCLLIERLDEVFSRAGEWHTAPNYSQAQTCIDVIDVQVVV